MPTFIRTVESAIEAMLSLPERTQARSHWIVAKEACTMQSTHVCQTTLAALKKGNLRFVGSLDRKLRYIQGTNLTK
jgi:hypothetical protein